MPIVRFARIAAVLGLLAGCSNLAGTFTVDRFLNKEITGDAVGACMARSYQAWARNKAWVQVDYVAAAALADRGAKAQDPLLPVTVFTCGQTSPSDSRRPHRFLEIARNDPSRACACGNAFVEIERWSCARPGDDKAALMSRFEAAAEACEGKEGPK